MSPLERVIRVEVDRACASTSVSTPLPLAASVRDAFGAPDLHAEMKPLDLHALVRLRAAAVVRHAGGGPSSRGPFIDALAATWRLRQESDA